MYAYAGPAELDLKNDPSKDPGPLSGDPRVFGERRCASKSVDAKQASCYEDFRLIASHGVVPEAAIRPDRHCNIESE